MEKYRNGNYILRLRLELVKVGSNDFLHPRDQPQPELLYILAALGGHSGY